MKTALCQQHSLHGDASAHTLATLRIGVFALWFWVLWKVQLSNFSSLPFELFRPFGFFAFVPDIFYKSLLTEVGLNALKWVLLLLSALLCLGVRGYRGMAISFGVLILLFDAVTKGFGSYSNHAQLSLMYISWILAVLPAVDRMALRKHFSGSPSHVYRFGILAASIALLLPYTFIGLHRLAKGGIDIFTGDAILIYSAVNSLNHSITKYDFGLLALGHPMAEYLMRIGFFVVTMAEVFSLVVLFNDRFRRIWLAVMVPFHFLSLFTMNIFFVENLLLFGLLLTRLPYYLTPRRSASGEIPTIFYDGECALCNRFVQFILKFDTERVLFFAPLQGETASRVLPSIPQDRNEWTILFRDGTNVYNRSSAVIRILTRMGGLWSFAAVLLWIPSRLRDQVYRWVARNRYRWFGSKSCLLPSSEATERILS